MSSSAGKLRDGPATRPETGTHQSYGTEKPDVALSTPPQGVTGCGQRVDRYSTLIPWIRLGRSSGGYKRPVDDERYFTVKYRDFQLRQQNELAITVNVMISTYR